MKIAIAILFCLCAVAAVGQTAPVLNGTPQPTYMPEHPLHAAPHAMATETPILGGVGETYAYEKGEQPLWEFGPVSQPVPLGDVSRAYRHEKAVAKKSQVSLEQ
jgi:hypothetical protein